MKKATSLLTACFIITGLSLSAISCKKNDIKDLGYMGMNKNRFLEAYVNKKGGGMVVRFQIHDQVGDKAAIDSYKKATDTFDTYPAIIFKNKAIWLLVNNRIEIRVTADDKAKDYQDTEELKKFTRLFDFAGLKEITGPKLKPEELQKFIPKLGGK